jgi:hypothetical protein
MDAVDGNAIAGTLTTYFGTEMTTATGRCGHCGACAQIAELRVYQRAPGTVVRCRNCGNVVIVVVDVRSDVRIDMSCFRLLEPTPG